MSMLDVNARLMKRNVGDERTRLKKLFPNGFEGYDLPSEALKHMLEEKFDAALSDYVDNIVQGVCECLQSSELVPVDEFRIFSKSLFFEFKVLNTGRVFKVQLLINYGSKNPSVGYVNLAKLKYRFDPLAEENKLLTRDIIDCMVKPELESRGVELNYTQFCKSLDQEWQPIVGKRLFLEKCIEFMYCESFANEILIELANSFLRGFPKLEEKLSINPNEYWETRRFVCFNNLVFEFNMEEQLLDFFKNIELLLPEVDEYDVPRGEVLKALNFFNNSFREALKKAFSKE